MVFYISILAESYGYVDSNEGRYSAVRITSARVVVDIGNEIGSSRTRGGLND